MAINRKDYPVKIETGLWADKAHCIFLYRFTYEKKENSGLIDLSDKSSWSKKDRITFAKSEFINIKYKKKDTVLSDKITLDGFMEKYFEQQPNTNYTKIRISHYERYISPICGLKRVVDLRQLHIRNSIKFQEEKFTLSSLSSALTRTNQSETRSQIHFPTGQSLIKLFLMSLD